MVCAKSQGKRISRTLVLAATIGAIAATGLLLSGGVWRDTSAAALAKSRLAAMRLRNSMPRYFELNVGQADHSARFISRGQHDALFLTADAAVFSLHGETAGRSRPPGGFSSGRRAEEASPTTSAAVRIRLVGASQHSQVEGLEQLPGRVNYLIGPDSSKWYRDVPLYARVRYREVYPGVDAIYYGSRDQLEYDLVVRPGADVSKIRFSIEGAARTALDQAGDLVIATGAGAIRIGKPDVYQQNADGERVAVAGKFLLAKDEVKIEQVPTRQVTFALGTYDRKRALFIDPVIATIPYSTYFGGNASSHGPVTIGQFFAVRVNRLTVSEAGMDVAVDPAGRAYITGAAYSDDLPVKHAFQATLQGWNLPPKQSPNVFVAKFDTALSGASSLIYATYLGAEGDPEVGDAGKGNGDIGYGIAVDGNGEAFVTGETYSANSTFPGVLKCGAWGQSTTRNAASTNVGFVSELNAAGNGLVYSCYIPGASNARGARVALEPGCATNCEAYVTGSTQSTPAEGFPVTAASAFQTVFKGTNSSNAFLLVVGANGAGATPEYCSYYGGTGNGVDGDAGMDVAVDTTGRAYMVGATYSSDLVLKNPAKSTYSGGTNQTSNVFVAIFDPSLAGANSLLYATYLGGTGALITLTGGRPTFQLGDIGTGIAVVESAGAAPALGRVWVTGVTASTDFQVPGVVTPVFEPTNVAALTQGPVGSAAFVTELDTTQVGLNQIQYSTYLSGSGHNLQTSPAPSAGTGEYGTDIAVTGGKVFVTGAATSPDFPLSANNCQAVNKAAGIDVGFFGQPLIIPNTGFVSVLDPAQLVAANQLAFSTYLGGTGHADLPQALQVDAAGNVVVAGFTFSVDLPVTPNAFQLNNNGNDTHLKTWTNAFLAKINPAGNTCPTPFPTPTATVTRTATPSKSATSTKTATATLTRTPTRTTTRTATKTASRTASRTATRTASRTATRTATRTVTRTPTATRTPTRTATRSSTRTASRSATRTGTRTATRTASKTATRTATRTASKTSTRTPSRTATPTKTASPAGSM